MLFLFFFEPFYQGFGSRLGVFLSHGFQVEVTFLEDSVMLNPSCLPMCNIHGGVVCVGRKTAFPKWEKKL